MVIQRKLHLITLQIRQGAIARLFKYTLLLINFSVLLWIIVYVNSFFSNILKHHVLTLIYEPTKYLEIPQAIHEIEKIKRQYLYDNTSEDFSVHFRSLIDGKSKHIYASKAVSIKRKLNDIRQPGCLRNNFALQKLPKASIIIIFCNELLSLILRGIWSILYQTPPDLLHEIILVDDGSNNTDITEGLPWYIKHRFKQKNIHLIRNQYQQHLVAAKLIGAKYATGDVLIFLEGHCEVTPGWIQPLLNHVNINRNAIAVPMLDFIDYLTLNLQQRNPDGSHMIVDFDWAGVFGYVYYTSRKGQNNYSKLDPLPSPIMTGGVFAVNRKFFWEIGGYDSGMYGWGGENFELSFRAWLCGGRLDIIPCSHVAHLDRDFKHRPYGNPQNSFGVNMMRTAEVWMDEYKRLFYLFHKHLKEDKSLGDIRDRVALKEQLKCKPFSWYVKNVIPNKYVPDDDAKMYGRVRNGRHTSICIDTLQREKDFYERYAYYILGTHHCHSHLAMSQYFGISKTDELRSLSMCADVFGKDGMSKIKMSFCNGHVNQKWQRTAWNGLIHIVSGKCLAYPSIPERPIESQDLVANDCNGSLEQIWRFEFMPNIHTLLHIPIEGKIKYNGRVRNSRFKDICLDDLQQHAPFLLSQYMCLGGNRSSVMATQNFSLTESNELKHFTNCADVIFCDGDYCGGQFKILMSLCNGASEQKWELTNWNGIKHVNSGRCITSPLVGEKSRNGEHLFAHLCDESLDQIWKFD